jgi:hypothetical protein
VTRQEHKRCVAHAQSNDGIHRQRGHGEECDRAATTWLQAVGEDYDCGEEPGATYDARKEKNA